MRNAAVPLCFHDDTQLAMVKRKKSISASFNTLFFFTASCETTKQNDTSRRRSCGMLRVDDILCNPGKIKANFWIELGPDDYHFSACVLLLANEQLKLKSVSSNKSLIRLNDLKRLCIQFNVLRERRRRKDIPQMRTSIWLRESGTGRIPTGSLLRREQRRIRDTLEVTPWTQWQLRFIVYGPLSRLRKQF